MDSDVGKKAKNYLNESEPTHWVTELMLPRCCWRLCLSHHRRQLQQSSSLTQVVRIIQAGARLSWCRVEGLLQCCWLKSVTSAEQWHQLKQQRHWRAFRGGIGGWERNVLWHFNWRILKSDDINLVHPLCCNLICTLIDMLSGRLIQL